MRAQTAFVRCEPTKALCFGVLYELQELCAVRAYKGFIQCAPGLVLLCTVRAPRALRGASLQRLCASVYRTSPKSFARCEPTKALCLCVLYEPHELCAVRTYKDFIQCAPGLVLLCTVRASRALCGASLFSFFFFFHLTYSRWTSSLPSCLWSQRIFSSLLGSRLTTFLSRCKFSTLTTCQPMVEFYLLTFPRFPLRKKEHKSYFRKNRTHGFRTSRCAAYLLDHSGNELQRLFTVRWCSPPRLCTECLCARAVV